MLGKRGECWGKEENAGDKNRMLRKKRRMLGKRKEENAGERGECWEKEEC